MSVAERPICGTVPEDRPIPQAILDRYEGREILAARWDGPDVVVELPDVVIVHKPGRHVWAAWFDSILDEWDRQEAAAAAPTITNADGLGEPG